MDPEEREALRRKDDYEAGKRAAEIQALQDGLERIERALTEHRAEEKATWDRFERTLEDLKLWRAKMMGIAGIVAFVVTSVWHYFLLMLKR